MTLGDIKRTASKSGSVMTRWMVSFTLKCVFTVCMFLPILLLLPPLSFLFLIMKFVALKTHSVQLAKVHCMYDYSSPLKSKFKVDSFTFKLFVVVFCCCCCWFLACPGGVDSPCGGQGKCKASSESLFLLWLLVLYIVVYHFVYHFVCHVSCLPFCLSWIRVQRRRMARAAVSVTVATGETPAISVIRSSTTTHLAV